MRLNNLLFSSHSSSSDPYKGLSKSELLDRFNSENWSQLDGQGKLQMLRAVGKIYAEENGIKDPPHIVEDYGDRYGGYNDWNNQIRISLDKCSNPYEALDTIAHEENHAYQAQCIKEGQGYTPEERALLKSENGSAYRTGTAAYGRQSLEIDSNNAGAKFLLQEQGRFQKDPAYAEYMSGRVAYFNNMADDYKNNREACDESESRQISEAFSRWKIDGDERQLAENCLQDGHNYIKEEALGFSERSREVLKESSVEWSNSLHEKFDQLDREGFPDEKYDGMKELQASIRANVAFLNSNKEMYSLQLAEKEKALADHITSNNMSRYESVNDSAYQSMAKEINELKTQIHTYDYHITELETDSELLERGYGEGCAEKEGIEGLEEEGTLEGKEEIEVFEVGVKAEEGSIEEVESLEKKIKILEIDNEEEIEVDDGLGEGNSGLPEEQEGYDDGLEEDGLGSSEGMAADGLGPEEDHETTSAGYMETSGGMDSEGFDSMGSGNSGGMDTGSSMG